jgi:hypothetical protein
MAFSEELRKAVDDLVRAGSALDAPPTVAQVDALKVATRGLELALRRHADHEAYAVLDELHAAGLPAAPTPDPPTFAEALSLARAFLGKHRIP